MRKRSYVSNRYTSAEWIDNSLQLQFISTFANLHFSHQPIISYIVLLSHFQIFTFIYALDKRHKRVTTAPAFSPCM